MGNPRAFLTIHRQEAGYRPVHERIDDFSEVEQTLNSGDRRTQASRCMDCGVPFCHWACPLGNKQPEWQDLLYKGRYKEAYHVLEQTDDFPFPVLLQDAKPGYRGSRFPGRIRTAYPTGTQREKGSRDR